MSKKRNLRANPKPPESKSPAESTRPVTTTPPDPPIKPSEQQLRESLKEAIGSVPNREEVVERVVSVVSQEIFRGPLPHPRHLQTYEEICPGLANRIVTMAEKAHNRAEDRLDKELEFEFADRRLGMWLGFGALVAFLSSGIFALSLGYSTTGAALLSAAAIGTVVLAFVNGRSRSTPMDDSSPQSTQAATPAKASLGKRVLARIRDFLGGI